MKKQKVEALRSISQALQETAKVMKERNKIEVMKLKLEYKKHFGSLVGFDEIMNNADSENIVQFRK